MERKETGISVWVLLLTAYLVTGLPWVCFHRGYTNTGLSTPEVHDHVHIRRTSSVIFYSVITLVAETVVEKVEGRGAVTTR